MALPCRKAFAVAWFAAAISLAPLAARAEVDGVCKQVVLVGRVTQAIDLGSSDSFNRVWKLDIDVKRVWRGTELRKHIVATATAEGQLRGATFAFFLFPGPDGGYGLASADLDLRRARSELKGCD